MSKEVRWSIILRDNIRGVLDRGAAAFRGFGRVVSGIAGGIGSVFKKVFSLPSLLMGGGLVGGLGLTLKKAFDMETVETQFKVLLGSTEAAKKRLKELSDFSAATPFELPDIAAASRQLHVFTDGAMGGADSLRDIGDASAAVGQNIQEVAFWVGRAYASIKGGQPFGEAAMRLQEMGILTPKVRQQMEELQKSGGSATRVFALLQNRLGEFSGGMDELSQTGNGLISTLKDNWSLALADFGKAFMGLAKGGLRDVIARIDELRSNGTIEAWAKKSADAVRVLGGVLGDVLEGGEKRKQAFQDMGMVVSAAFKDAAAAMINVLRPAIHNMFVSAAGMIHDSVPAFLRGNDPRLNEFVETDSSGNEIYRGSAPPPMRGGNLERALSNVSGRQNAITVESMNEDSRRSINAHMAEIQGRMSQRSATPISSGESAISARVKGGGESIGLGEIFTRMDDKRKGFGVGPGAELGTDGRPMVVTVKELRPEAR
jgi:hypothetical protein